LLVLREILSEEGFDIQQLFLIGVKFQKLVNLVFPRTFFSQHKKEHYPDIGNDVAEYYKEVLFQLSLQGMDESKLESVAIEETSSKFGMDIEQVKEILRISE
jgi:hypothetical protein